MTRKKAAWLLLARLLAAVAVLSFGFFFTKAAVVTLIVIGVGLMLGFGNHIRRYL